MTTSDLAIRDEQESWTSNQIAALRQLGLQSAPDADLALFFHLAKRSGLDPFARQVYMIGRNDSRSGTVKFTIQTGIDGLRLVAHRAAERAGHSLGYEETLWCGPDGAWVDVWLTDTPPVAAKVVVLRNGQRFPAVAKWSEYAQPTSPMWRKMPALMLSKCAEALALRKAYPQDLTGLYTPEEMDQASAPADAAPDPEVLSALVERALAAAGDAPALQAVWYDARSVGLLDAEVTHEGKEGTLGSLVLHLRTATPPDPQPEPEPAPKARGKAKPDPQPQPEPVARQIPVTDSEGNVIDYVEGEVVEEDGQGVLA